VSDSHLDELDASAGGFARALCRGANGRDKGLLWDLHDIFTRKNILVAVAAALIGYVLLERLRDGVQHDRRKY
jgi:hypothetical protein